MSKDAEGYSLSTLISAAEAARPVPNRKLRDALRLLVLLYGGDEVAILQEFDGKSHLAQLLRDIFGTPRNRIYKNADKKIAFIKSIDDLMRTGLSQKEALRRYQDKLSVTVEFDTLEKRLVRARGDLFPFG